LANGFIYFHQIANRFADGAIGDRQGIGVGIGIDYLEKKLSSRIYTSPINTFNRDGNQVILYRLSPISLYIQV